MEPAVNKRNALRILTWCKKQYGASKFNSIKSLSLHVNNHLKMNDDISPASGEYDPVTNQIVINLREHATVLSLIDTVIHEYTHFKQDIKVKFQKYSASDENHPYEKTAVRRAKRDRRKCLKEVFN